MPQFPHLRRTVESFRSFVERTRCMNTGKGLGPRRAHSQRGLTRALEKYAFSQRTLIIRRQIQAPPHGSVKRPQHTHTQWGSLKALCRSEATRCFCIPSKGTELAALGMLSSSQGTHGSLSQTQTRHRHVSRAAYLRLVDTHHPRATFPRNVRENRTLGTVGYA